MRRVEEGSKGMEGWRSRLDSIGLDRKDREEKKGVFEGIAWVT